jgi:hypothetical protein
MKQFADEDARRVGRVGGGTSSEGEEMTALSFHKMSLGGGRI